MSTSHNAKPVNETVEDLDFLATVGVGITEAAQRTGFESAKNLDKWLRRHDQAHLIGRLVRHEPRPVTPSRKAS